MGEGGCTGPPTTVVSGYTTETWIISGSSHDIVRMIGTLAECAARCNAEPTCIGFSRATTYSDDALDVCWLKSTMDAAYRTTSPPYITHRNPLGAKTTVREPKPLEHVRSPSNKLLTIAG